ncbi:thioredoxin domain-containing protein isoform X2 [Tribolium madens]|uniref:thioredoxin domain-containing protein isoform X2 n=1 Tax=Tribolium madens TaxID=41895 RepID=UPI001CF7618B|nr:thioredoxin domain-containing protein isoform X2 [Tribolium madens]
MNACLYVLSCLFIILNSFSNSGAIKSIQDDDLMNLIRSETYVVALFSAKNCELCDNFENVLTNLKEEFLKSFEGPTVKVVNSQLTRLYSPTKEPVLVFFRHGIPLLYNDVPSEELILHTFLNNKEPVVKELNDETFEHLTQASTGATTGDWFVMFYAPDCVDCHRLQARWETVGAQLKTRMNVARVNKATDGAATAARFGVSQAPTFILFRQGKMYKYQIQKYDIASFTSFAQEWYKNVTPLRVPSPKTPDNIVENIVLNLQESTMIWKICLAATFVGLLLIILMKCRKTEKPQKPASKKGDKDK